MRVSFNSVIGELTTMPGSTQVCISHGLFLPPELRGKGLANEAMSARLTYIFRDLGYDMVMCTVDDANAVEKHILETWGWEPGASFTSSKTGHEVRVWTITRDTFNQRFMI